MGDLGDDVLNAMRDRWRQSPWKPETRTLDLLKAAPGPQRRMVLLKLYTQVVAERGMADDPFVQKVVRLAERAISGELDGFLLDQAFHMVGVEARTSNGRGNCVISAVLLTPKLCGYEMPAHLQTFARELKNPAVIDEITEGLLGGK